MWYQCVLRFYKCWVANSWWPDVDNNLMIFYWGIEKACKPSPLSSLEPLTRALLFLNLRKVVHKVQASWLGNSMDSPNSQVGTPHKPLLYVHRRLHYGEFQPKTSRVLIPLTSKVAFTPHSVGSHNTYKPYTNKDGASKNQQQEVCKHHYKLWLKLKATQYACKH